MVEKFGKRGHALHQSGEEVGRTCLAFAATTIVPNCHLVDVDALDGLDLCLDEVWQLLQEKQRVSLRGVASCSLYHLVVTLGLFREDLEETFRLCLHLGEDGIGLTFCIDSLLLSLSFSRDNQTLFLNLLSHDDVGLLTCTLSVCSGILSFLLCRISLFESLSACNLLSSHSFALSLSLPFTTNCIRIGNRNLGFVLTLHSLGIGFSSTDSGLSNSLSLTYFTIPFLLSNTNFSFVDCLCSSLLTESLDVAAFILDIGHVHIDQAQTDLLQFYLDVSRDSLKELVAIGVQLLDTHRGNNQTKLAEKDVSSQFLNLLRRLSKQAFCSSQHAFGLRTDTNCKAARHIHANVLLRKGIRQVCIDADRRKREVSVVLDDGPYESATTMHTLGTLAVATITIDNQYLITWAATIAVDDGHEEEDEYDDSNHNKIEGFHIS